MRYKLVKTPSDMHQRFKDSKNPTCHFCYCSDGDDNICNNERRDVMKKLLGSCTPNRLYHYEMIKCIVPLNISIL